MHGSKHTHTHTPPPRVGVCAWDPIYNTPGIMLITDYLSYYPNNDIGLFTW